MITQIGKAVFVRDPASSIEMARRGGGMPHAFSSRRIADGIRAGQGSFYLRLTDAQNKALQDWLRRR